MNESSYVCNHAAGFTRCMTKIQDIQDNVRILQQEVAKWKSSHKCKKALDDLNDRTSFNLNVAYCVGKATQHLANVMFNQMANFTLMKRDPFLDHLKQGVKQDNWSILRNTRLYLQALFPTYRLGMTYKSLRSCAVTPNPHQVQGS